ncbi:MAG: hypothetical protein A2289_03925 [Deltaproteobacteria bacterium RIFOXYA12_FULL_58_15]|nr:MAG: hypothetical protein A2289_03925 [Deltaproteobacteria bacterium RIFOXYA12_FULL_58_15]
MVFVSLSSSQSFRRAALSALFAIWWSRTVKVFSLLCVVGNEIGLVVIAFQASPQTFDEDVVKASTLSVHAHLHPCCPNRTGEVVANELATLITVEDLCVSMPESVLKRLQAE